MESMTEEERYWLWLSSVDGIGPVRFYDVLNTFTDLRIAWDHVDEIAEKVPGIGKNTAAALRESRSDAYIDAFLETCRKKGIRILTRLSQDYPHLLAEIDNPPPVLYYIGTLPELDDMSCGIVGSRRPTRKGFETARRLGSSLASQGVAIVSGMARGIDAAAHLGALDANGRTVAVLGCGVDIVYPRENTELYDRIQQHGAVVSEFVPGTLPKPGNFPQRNRIISGLSKVLVAGEGGEKSGARITVDDALAQGREVYTVACDLNSPMAKLPIYLMDAGAPLVSSAAEIMQDQGWEMRFGIEAGDARKETNKLDLLQARIYNLLLKETFTAGQLAKELDLPISEVNTVLTVMELNGTIDGVPGDKFRVNT